MGRVIAVANQKGGVAKTTTVASLGVALAELGRRVLLVDLDPQACLTFSLGLDPGVARPVGARRAARPGQRLGRDRGAPRTVRRCCRRPSTSPAPRRCCCRAPAASTCCAKRSRRSPTATTTSCSTARPSLGVLTINALTAADEVLIPLQCETLSHRGVGQLLDTIVDVQRLTNRGLRVRGVLPTLYRRPHQSTPARWSPMSPAATGCRCSNRRSRSRSASPRRRRPAVRCW